MKLPLETSLEEAMRAASQQGKLVVTNATAEQTEASIQESLQMLPGIKTLADLKQAFDNGNLGWRNSESASEGARLAYLFDLITDEQYEHFTGHSQS